jgi:hypothetical protein
MLELQRGHHGRIPKTGDDKMNAHEFAYWLQGFSELSADPPTAEQWQSIKDHLATVFKKVTPPIGLPWANQPPLQPLRAECAVRPNAGIIC